jgi:hypothetical protein
MRYLASKNRGKAFLGLKSLNEAQPRKIILCEMVNSGLLFDVVNIDKLVHKHEPLLQIVSNVRLCCGEDPASISRLVIISKLPNLNGG